MIRLPNLLAKLTNEKGLIQNPWNSFLQQFVQEPPAFVTLSFSASPFEYEAREPGNLAIVGGTITEVTLNRGSETISLDTTRVIPLAINDVVSITYSVAPTSVKFIPAYGQNTTS